MSPEANSTPTKKHHKKNSISFLHDGNARNDSKCVKLRKKHGPAGYGVFWMIVEYLRQVGLTLPESDLETLGDVLGIEQDLLNAVIATCIEVGLFEISSSELNAPGLTKRIEAYRK